VCIASYGGFCCCHSVLCCWCFCPHAHTAHPTPTAHAAPHTRHSSPGFLNAYFDHAACSTPRLPPLTTADTAWLDLTRHAPACCDTPHNGHHDSHDSHATKHRGRTGTTSASTAPGAQYSSSPPPALFRCQRLGTRFNALAYAPPPPHHRTSASPNPPPSTHVTLTRVAQASPPPPPRDEFPDVAVSEWCRDLCRASSLVRASLRYLLGSSTPSAPRSTSGTTHPSRLPLSPFGSLRHCVPHAALLHFNYPVWGVKPWVWWALPLHPHHVVWQRLLMWSSLSTCAHPNPNTLGVVCACRVLVLAPWCLYSLAVVSHCAWRNAWCSRDSRDSRRGSSRRAHIVFFARPACCTPPATVTATPRPASNLSATPPLTRRPTAGVRVPALLVRLRLLCSPLAPRLCTTPAACLCVAECWRMAVRVVGIATLEGAVGGVGAWAAVTAHRVGGAVLVVRYVWWFLCVSDVDAHARTHARTHTPCSLSSMCAASRCGVALRVELVDCLRHCLAIICGGVAVLTCTCHLEQQQQICVRRPRSATVVVGGKVSRPGNQRAVWRGHHHLASCRRVPAGDIQCAACVASWDSCRLAAARHK